MLNEGIEALTVRLIDAEGNNLGIVNTKKALEMAYEAGLDLLLVSPGQDPPVGKILDYGKYKFDTGKKAKEAKKKQHTVDVKEIKMRYRIDKHDFDVRVKSAIKFLTTGNKVKLIIVLRGREVTHAHLAFELMDKFLDALQEVNFAVDKNQQLEGKNIIAILSPVS